MKYLKRIIFILILILILTSCKKESDSEIKYTLYENVELGECDEFDVSYKIPSHQYVHITFTKNTPWIIYNLNVYEKNKSSNNQLIEFVAKTNVFQKDLDELYQVKKYKLWEYNGRDSYLCNGDYYFDIYNDEKVERELGCKLYNSKEAIIYNGSFDICEDLHFVSYDNAFICKLWLSDHYGEKYEVKYNGNENITMKILDSYGNDVGMDFSRDYDINNCLYYICIYKNENLNDTIDCYLCVDYAKIYDGYDFEIGITGDSRLNGNYFSYNCIEDGYYDIKSSNINVTRTIYYNKDIINTTSKGVYLEKGKKYYIRLLNLSLTESQTGTINITKLEEQ